MKNFLFISFVLLLFLLPNMASAQLSLGPGVVYSTEFDYVGIQARGLYEFNEDWMGQADFTFYFAETDITVWDLDANANYVYVNEENIKAYALAGLNFVNVSVDVDTPFGSFGGSSSEVGLNLGTGALFPVGTNTNIFGEVKYILGDADRLVLAAGALFGLN